MPRLAVIAFIMGCTPSHTPTDTTAAASSSFASIKGAPLVPSSAAKVADSLKLPEEPLLESEGFMVAGAWGGPPRALLEVADPASQTTRWTLLDLLSGDTLAGPADEPPVSLETGLEPEPGVHEPDPGPLAVQTGLAASSLSSLSESWWAALPPNGGVEAIHEDRASREPLFEDPAACTGGVVFEGGLVEPPRLLASCRLDEARVELRLWSPELTWSWLEYIHPLPETRVTISDRPAVGFGEPASGRQTWINLEAARRLETPPLATPGSTRAAAGVFFALEQGELGHSLYKVDLPGQELEMWGLVLDCPGELNLVPGDDHTLLECWQAQLTWVEVLFHGGQTLRVKGQRVEAALPAYLVLSDRTRETGPATRLFLAEVPPEG